MFQLTLGYTERTCLNLIICVHVGGGHTSANIIIMKAEIFWGDENSDELHAHGLRS